MITFNICKYTHVYYIDSLNEVFLLGLIMLPLPGTDFLIKIPGSGMRKPPLSCWSRECKLLPKKYRLLFLPLVVSKMLKVSPYC